MAKSMQIAATKSMAAALNERIPEFTVSQVKLSAHNAELLVGYPSPFKMLDDLIETSGLYRAIKIEYPPECYAMPVYVSTYDLLQIFRRNDSKTIDDFSAAFLENYAI